MTCPRCGGTAKVKWCSNSGKITGPCPKCNPGWVATAVRNHIRRIWGERKPSTKGARP